MSRFLGGLQQARDRHSQSTQGQLETATARAGERGRAAEGEFYDRALAFDPQAAVQQSATAAYGSFRDQLGEDIQDLRGQQVGMGRLDTGFATQDEDRLVRSGMDRLNNLITQQSLQAAGMEQNQIGMIGQHAGQQSGRYLDLLSGQADREEMRRNADKERKASRWGTLGTLAGMAASPILGPGAAAVGNRIGSWVDDRIGG